MTGAVYGFGIDVICVYDYELTYVYVLCSGPSTCSVSLKCQNPFTCSRLVSSMFTCPATVTLTFPIKISCMCSMNMFTFTCLCSSQFTFACSFSLTCLITLLISSMLSLYGSHSRKVYSDVIPKWVFKHDGICKCDRRFERFDFGSRRDCDIMIIIVLSVLNGV